MADPSLGHTAGPRIAARARGPRPIRPGLAWGAMSAVLGAALIASLLWRPRPLLLWNATPSSTVGLYAVSAPAVPAVGDTVVAWPPATARRMASARGYLPFDVPLVKRVAAVRGDRVCAMRGRIFINGRSAASRHAYDPAGRPMPRWSGCVRLERGQIFLLSAAGPLAWDGRYFGISRTSEIVGRARPLWTKQWGAQHD